MAARSFHQELMTALWEMTVGWTLMCRKLIRLGLPEMAQTMNHCQCRERSGLPQSFLRKWILQVVKCLNRVESRFGLPKCRIWLVNQPLFDGQQPVLQVRGRAQIRCSQLMVEPTGNSIVGLFARRKHPPASVQSPDTHTQSPPSAATDLVYQK